MRSGRFNTTDRLTALLALSAFVIVLWATSGAFAAGGDSDGEPCVACAGCDAGECGDEDETPLTSHHHCCMSCCMTHAPVALLATPSISVPTAAEPLIGRTSASVSTRSPETPYRPPRA